MRFLTKKASRENPSSSSHPLDHAASNPSTKPNQPTEERQLDAMLSRAPTSAASASGVTFNPPLVPPSSPPALGSDPTFPFATTAALFPPAVHDALDLAGLLSPRELAVRDRAREFMVSWMPMSLAPPPPPAARKKANSRPPPKNKNQQVKEVAPIITPYWERAEFPFELLPKLQTLDLGGANLSPQQGGQGLSVMECAMACFEMARVDASVATFYLVHNFLALLTVGMLGSEEHRRELVPKMRKLEAVGCWGLTEPGQGSDAAALQMTASPLPDGKGWRLDGTKRWIGNAPFADVLVVWARNTSTNSVNAFIVRKGNPGLRVGKIQNKTALRCVQNGDIVLEGCIVPECDRLPGVNGFGDTNKVLAVSRVMVAWLPVGEFFFSGCWELAGSGRRALFFALFCLWLVFFACVLTT